MKGINKNALSLLWLLLPIGAFLPSTSCSAHGDLHELIQAASFDIQQHPDSAELYLRRGRLYFQHKNYEESISDLEAARNRGLAHGELDLLLARNHQQLGDFDEALVWIAKIEADGDHALAMKTKAEVLFSLNRFEESALCFERLISSSNKALPTNYLAAAKSWQAMKNEIGNNKALAIINRGISDLGELFVFNKAKVDHYISQQQWSEALFFQEIIIENARRKEMAYFEAAKIAAAIPDSPKVLDYLKAAESSIKELPLNRRKITAIQDLELAIEKLRIQQN